MPLRIELAQEEVQDVMNRPPHWMVRVGSVVMLSLITVVVVLLCIIRIPQGIQGNFTIDPSGNALLRFAEADIPGIRSGMPVELHFNAYPSSRFGYIAAVVNNTADTLNADHTISLQVSLPPNITTSEKQPLHLKQGMSGKARIITGSVSLLGNLWHGKSN